MYEFQLVSIRIIYSQRLFRIRYTLPSSFTFEGNSMEVLKQFRATGGLHAHAQPLMSSAQLAVHVSERHGESHDCIAHELKLILERHVGIQSLPGGALTSVLAVVRGQRAVLIPTLEVILPKLWKILNKQRLKVFLGVS